MDNRLWNRREFGGLILGAAAVEAARGRAPAVMQGDSSRPAIEQGVASGDVAEGSAVVWSRTDRPSRIVVEYATTDAFRDPRHRVPRVLLNPCRNLCRAHGFRVRNSWHPGPTVFASSVYYEVVSRLRAAAAASGRSNPFTTS